MDSPVAQKLGDIKSTKEIKDIINQWFNILERINGIHVRRTTDSISVDIPCTVFDLIKDSAPVTMSFSYYTFEAMILNYQIGEEFEKYFSTMIKP